MWKVEFSQDVGAKEKNNGLLCDILGHLPYEKSIPDILLGTKEGLYQVNVHVHMCNNFANPCLFPVNRN